MAELIIQPFEVVNICHDHGHTSSVAASAFDLFNDSQFEEAAVKNSGQSVEIGQLFHALHVVRVLNGVGANISDGFKRLQFALTKSIGLRTVQREQSQSLAEGN